MNTLSDAQLEAQSPLFDVLVFFGKLWGSCMQTLLAHASTLSQLILRPEILLHMPNNRWWRRSGYRWRS